GERGDDRIQAVFEKRGADAAPAHEAAPAYTTSDAGGGRPIAEGRFRSLVEQLPLSVYIDRLDAVSSNIYTSPQIERLLGYSVAEWVENTDLFVELLHPDDRERVLAAHQRTHATGEPLSVEYRLRRKDGSWVWVQDEALVVSDGCESVLQGYLLDVTARRDAEEQLRPRLGVRSRLSYEARADFHIAPRSPAAPSWSAVTGTFSSGWAARCSLNQATERAIPSSSVTLGL